MAATHAAAEAWRLLQELSCERHSRLQGLASEFGLAPAQVQALCCLDPSAPAPMSHLAGALRCDNSNVTGIVSRLEARGLVKRRPGVGDRRVRMLSVTAEGARIRSVLMRRMGEPPPALAGLSAADQRALREILARALGSET